MRNRDPEHQSEHVPDGGLDYCWHLARTPTEIAVTELEFALMRANEGFGRWQSECLSSVCDLAASGPENAMLHVIRMNGRPKTLKDLARLTNRDDVPNIQYSLRKLIGAGLVLRKGAGRSGVTYEVTQAGARVCDDYAALRRLLLMDALASLPDLTARLDDAAHVLNLMSGIYAEIARVAATHRRS